MLYRIDGWDYYPPNAFGQTSPGTNFMADGWTGSMTNIGTLPGRFGGNSFWLGSNFTAWEAIGKRFTTETAVIGAAAYVGAAGLMTGGVGFYDAESQGYLNCFVFFDQDGIIRVGRGTGGSASFAVQIIATTPAKNVHPFEWNYIEIKYLPHDTAGIIEVRVNTVVVISYTGRTTNPNTIRILGEGPGWDTLAYQGYNQLQWDDRYILDDTGSHNTDYLGNVKVNTQLTTAPGDLTQMSVFGAAANWDAVNESALTEVEYVYTPTMGNSDLYTMNPNVAAQNIFGIQVTGAHRQDDSTQLKSNLLIKTGGTVYPGSDHVLAQNYHYYRDVWEINPNTGVGWTPSDVNALQAGQKALLA